MKRRPELAPLSRDHNRALLLARRARQAASGTSGLDVAECWSDLRDAWESELATHFAAEERLLFPRLQAHGHDELATELQREHDAIRRTLTQADRLDATRLGVLGEVLEHHVRVEEREAFPLLERILSATELSVIAAGLEATGQHGNTTSTA